MLSLCFHSLPLGLLRKLQPVKRKCNPRATSQSPARARPRPPGRRRPTRRLTQIFPANSGCSCAAAAVIARNRKIPSASRFQNADIYILYNDYKKGNESIS